MKNGPVNEPGTTGTELAIVLHPYRKGRSRSNRTADASLAELVGLAQAINLNIVIAECIPVAKPRPATWIGKGAVENVVETIRGEDIEIAVVDGVLTPVQQRNLEQAWCCKVIDRTGIILEIFGDRARTREGSLQVELAHLTYQRSRLVRTWTHLERQRGGFGFMGGPGETQIESDRRQIDQRITKIKRELKTVTRTRGLHRSARQKVPFPVVALVGYTNAGKSTLFNRLTNTKVFAEDILFATLDPTMRAVELPSGQSAILSDTVGFVSALPTDLIAAFRATLEEVLEADIIVHVRDISHPDSEAQKADVLLVLTDLGIEEKRLTEMFEARNKIDLLDDESRAMEANRAARYDEVAVISATTGDGCDVLLAQIDERLKSIRHVVDISVALTNGAAIAWLYRRGEVLDRHDDETQAHMTVGLDPADHARFMRRREGAAP